MAIYSGREEQGWVKVFYSAGSPEDIYDSLRRAVHTRWNDTSAQILYDDTTRGTRYGLIRTADVRPVYDELQAGLVQVGWVGKPNAYKADLYVEIHRPGADALRKIITRWRLFPSASPPEAPLLDSRLAVVHDPLFREILKELPKPSR